MLHLITCHRHIMPHLAELLLTPLSYTMGQGDNMPSLGTSFNCMYSTAMLDGFQLTCCIASLCATVMHHHIGF